jgi:hypothetical protein
LRAELLAFTTGKHDDIAGGLGLVSQLMDKFAPGRSLLKEAAPLRDGFMTL